MSMSSLEAILYEYKQSQQNKDAKDVFEHKILMYAAKHLAKKYNTSVQFWLEADKNGVYRTDKTR